MNLETVSVIVPAWGCVPFLQRALDSLRAQTYPHVEVVVAEPPVDGPQTLPAARQAGLARATGDWILFCDADDWLESEAISEMVAYARRESADCVCCGLIRDGLDGQSVCRSFDACGPCDTYNALVNKLFRRRLLEGLVVDRRISLGEDLMVTAQALARARHVVVFDRAFYHYCENAQSVTHVQDGRARVENLARVDALLRTVLASPVHDDFLDRLTRDVLLLWIRHRVFDRALWRQIRRRIKGPLLGDPRHGLIKKGALAVASCLFD